MNVTDSTVAAFLSSMTGRRCVAPRSSRIASALARGIGAVKRTVAGSTGLQPACGLTRPHSNRAANALARFFAFGCSTVP